MARAPRRPSQQQPAAPEPRALRSSTAAARAHPQPQPPATRASRKRAASDADASSAPAAASRAKQQRRAARPSPQANEPEAEQPPPQPPAAARAGAAATTPPPSSSRETKHRASSGSSSSPVSPQLLALAAAPLDTPPASTRTRDFPQPPETPEASLSGDRSGGKQPARRSFGSDGSSALGGSERSVSTRSLWDGALDPPLHRADLGAPDAMLHVGSCSFAVHLSEIATLGKRLRNSLAAAREEPEPRGEVTRTPAVLVRTVDRSGRPAFLPLRCTLHRVDRTRNLVTAHGSELALSSSPAVCPLDAGRRDDERRSGARATTPFAIARCLAHSASRTSVTSGASASDVSPGQRSDARASPREALRGIREADAGSTRHLVLERASTRDWSVAKPGDSSSTDARQRCSERADASEEGKENRARNSRHAPAQRIHTQRKLLAEVDREHEKHHRGIRSQRFSANEAEASSLHGDDGDAHSRIARRRSSAPAATEMVHIEWHQASAAAVATVVEFVYTHEVRFVDPTRAYDVMQLCQWIGVSGELMHTSLRVAIAHMILEHWVNLCVACAQVADESVRNALLESLFGFLRGLPHSRTREVLAKAQVEGLGGIRDADVLGRIVMCFQINVKQADVWRNLVLVLDEWGKRKFGRQGFEQPLSLLELHRQFAWWDPFVTFADTRVSGEDGYVRPTTLFEFGEFAFQVRFEMSSVVLMQWRVVKEPRDPDDDARFRPADPRFLLRGELKVAYKRFRGDARHEETVSLRYTHSAFEYNVWKPLLKASPHSNAAPQVSTLAEHAARLGRGLASQSEAEASQPASQPAEHEDAPEFLRAAFTGRFFVWGHRLVALRHYLAGRTVFLSAPTGARGELMPMTPLETLHRAPLDTLAMLLQSDRLHVPGGETTLVKQLTTLCFEAHGLSAAHAAADFADVAVVRTLFGCVRWRYVDEVQILRTLQLSARKYQLYELVVAGLEDPLLRFPRRTPNNETENPYRECTTLVEFVMNAGDDGFSPSQYSQGPTRTPSSEEQ